MAKTDPKANWHPAKVKQEIAPRSYLITDHNDRVLRCNRAHLMKVPEPSSTYVDTRSTRRSGETRPASEKYKVKVDKKYKVKAKPHKSRLATCRRKQD
jgi:hypothetical protein